MTSRQPAYPCYERHGSPVATSAGATARPPHGFAWLLGTLAATDDADPGPLQNTA